MNEAADDKDVKEQSSSRMQIPLADLRSWCAVWASRKQQYELRLNLQRLIEQIDNADDGFPERPDEFDYEEPDDGTEGYFYLTVCFSHPGEFRFFVNRKGGALQRVSFVWGENGNIFSTDLEGPELALLTKVWGWLEWNGEYFYPAWAAVDASVAIASEPGSQADDRPCQDILIGPASWRLALCRPMLAEHCTGAALGYVQLIDYMIDTATAA